MNFNQMINGQISSINYKRATTMSVNIQYIDEKTFQVNSKTVRQDIDGEWLATEEMTPGEIRAFQDHLKVQEIIKQPASATYKR